MGKEEGEGVRRRNDDLICSEADPSPGNGERGEENPRVMPGLTCEAYDVINSVYIVRKGEKASSQSAHIIIPIVMKRNAPEKRETNNNMCNVEGGEKRKPLPPSDDSEKREEGRRNE